MVECNVGVKFAVAKVEVQNRPAAAATERGRRSSKALFPFVEAAEIASDGLLDVSRSFSITAEISEIFFMEDCGIFSDQLFHFQTFDLKPWRVVWHAREHLLNLTDAARGSRVIVVVM